MLTLVDVTSKTSSQIAFSTEQISSEGSVVYVVYDTSTGIPTSTMADYMVWRTITSKTSTGAIVVDFVADNTTLHPSYTTAVLDYTVLDLDNFSYLTLQEYLILKDLLIRFDLVRRRLPNPGTTISSTNSVGQNGSVSFAGGHEKKMTVSELITMMTGAIIELNWTPPQTSYWPIFTDLATDKLYNPYQKNTGLPFDMVDLVVRASLIRCLCSMGILEVDVSFTVTDSGLSITFDRATPTKGWHDSLIQQYIADKTLFKWNHANHYGVAIGTYQLPTVGAWGSLLNNVTYGGQMSLGSLLGFGSIGTTPM